jgi:ADP-ribose pyrophosphatase YjhB (NUDIX family)
MIFQEATLRQRIGRTATPLYLLLARLSRGMTVGVRGAVLDEASRIFLVKHTYVPGWYLPGGGVDLGETAEAALARELMEEGNIKMTGRPELLGLYLNKEASIRDHVAFFAVRDFEQTGPRPRDRRLPDGIW